MILSIFEANVSENPPGCGLELNNLTADEVVLSHFPLHDFKALRSLEKKWLIIFTFNYTLPLEEIKDYFGEKIGLYFTFLNYINNWLIYPAILGIFVYACKFSLFMIFIS